MIVRPSVLFIGLFLVYGALSVDYCSFGEKCWPSTKTWSKFNASIDGRLIAPRPPAWPCHDPDYNEAACNEVKSNWESSLWRANQAGAMQDPVWESPGCDIYTPRNVSCSQGFVPAYSVVALNGSDVSKAVSFARKYKLKLVIKNTGHDYLGRSSGAGSFSIWTRNLKGIKFTNAFIPDGCPKYETAVPAVTIGAAEHWIDVYKAANDHNVTVVGGATRTVGAAGGWVQGGGHSPLGALYGMGVDNALQFTVVKSDGEIVTANSCQNKDLFWALRGGGGSTYGVTLDVTYKTHPPLRSVVMVAMQVNCTSPEQMTDMTAAFFRALPHITDQGARGYGVWMVPNNSFMVLLIHPNSPSVEATNNTVQLIFDRASQNNGTVVGTIGTIHSTFYEMFTMFVTYTGDSGIAVPIWLGSRLVSRVSLLHNSEKMAELIVASPHVSSVLNIVGGGAVNDFDPDSAGLNPQWRRDALLHWTFNGRWSDQAPDELIGQIKHEVTSVTQRLGALSGLDHAAYFNEADPGEPQWEQAFFGSHYDRLLEIKKQIDPHGVFTCNRCVGTGSVN
ncbi:unnamed protein product [Rhizoctonia solani]|uniref:FAD-binding PCMH-type domain-containing protein n=1 Tax=Rhizoctonia solani TaxID=456999 RepID=A0A8H3DM82_9AGAM|nr:unnamed protein product [Rhizoctonia solani]